MPITKVGLTTGDFANSLSALPDCLDKFEALGVDSVELILATLDVVSGTRILPAQMRKLKAICADRPFGFTLHGPISGTFMDRAHLQMQIDTCRAALEVAGEIGANAQVHHGGSAPTGSQDEIDTLMGLERETLAAIAPVAQDHGVVLCVENIFGDGARWFASPAELAAQIRAVDHPNIRGTIDFSHAAINATVRGFDLMESLTAMAPLAGHLHIHDSFGKPQTFKPFTYGEAINYGLGDLHLPPGWGGLNWDAFARLPFAEDVVANLELSTRWDDALEESIALVRGMIATSLGLAAA
ncbi:MAG: sugar phosphate isomerase/epimerase [Neomegalonema sp.]|nr:sugar phosphate isomerase/epimerase [Neomegalonema sp.]